MFAAFFGSFLIWCLIVFFAPFCEVSLYSQFRRPENPQSFDQAVQDNNRFSSEHSVGRYGIGSAIAAAIFLTVVFWGVRRWVRLEASSSTKDLAGFL